MLMTSLDIAALHASVTDPVLESMTFLNEIADRFPEAVSFAPGRPSELDYDADELPRYLKLFRDHLAADRGCGEAEITRTIFQYGPAKGVINDLVARNLLQDEGIHADPASIVVTVGCQEAILLVLRALRVDARDAVLAVSPTYVGLTGAARLVDMPVLPVHSGPAGVDLEDFVRQVRHARAQGLRPRACYVMADCANPSGTSLSLETRRRLIDVAHDEGVLLLEDNPYGLFQEDEDRLPTLKALDRRRTVVYLGSFAKTALPGARVGYVVADQEVRDGDRTAGVFADALAKIKSMVTVNTSPVSQAVIGGRLLAHDASLVAANAAAAARYRDNRRQVLDGLQRRFGGLAPLVSWNAPSGGFFVVLTVPFIADDALVERSAVEHGVLWTPMHHFYDCTEGLPALRLSFSALDASRIEVGLDRLAGLVAEQPAAAR
jgi:(S)-3,5-dihydroxyphenylglycine transaminase